MPELREALINALPFCLFHAFCNSLSAVVFEKVCIHQSDSIGSGQEAFANMVVIWHTCHSSSFSVSLGRLTQQAWLGSSLRHWPEVLRLFIQGIAHTVTIHCCLTISICSI